jgi:prohead serine protease
MEAAMDSKALSSVEIKDAEQGTVSAVFSTFGVVDRDGDITVKGAIPDGAKVRISSYNHGSWQGSLPVGKGVIRIIGNEAHLEGQFFMNTTHGRDTFETIKALSEDGQQEWSYGFDVKDSEAPGEEHKGAKRVLKSLNVYEVSPVMMGAGIGTRTLVMKGEEYEYKRTFSAEQRRELARSGKAMPDGSFPIVNKEDLSNAIGLAGNASDPGAARAHIRRRARALGATDMIPDTWDKKKAAKRPDEDSPRRRRRSDEDDDEPQNDEQAEEEDDEEDEDEPRKRPPKKKFSDHALEVLADIAEVRERAAEVVAKRAEKDKGLGEESAEILIEIKSELSKLSDLLEEEDNSEAEAAWLRHVRSEMKRSEGK